MQNGHETGLMASSYHPHTCASLPRTLKGIA